jgi:hypothetical protein
LSHSVGQNHETLLRTDQEARTKDRTGRDAHPCHQDRRKPVRSRRSRAFSQDRWRPQAPRGLIPILILLENSGRLTEVARNGTLQALQDSILGQASISASAILRKSRIHSDAIGVFRDRFAVRHCSAVVLERLCARLESARGLLR